MDDMFLITDFFFFFFFFFFQKSIGKPDKPLSSVIPKALLECIKYPKASWKLTRNMKGFSLAIRTFAAKTAKPLKGGQAAFGCQQGSHTDTTDDSRLKRPKRKNKSSSQIARDRTPGDNLKMPFLNRKTPFIQNRFFWCL